MGKLVRTLKLDNFGIPEVIAIFTKLIISHLIDFSFSKLFFKGNLQTFFFYKLYDFAVVVPTVHKMEGFQSFIFI